MQRDGSRCPWTASRHGPAMKPSPTPIVNSSQLRSSGGWAAEGNFQNMWTRVTTVHQHPSHDSKQMGRLGVSPQMMGLPGTGIAASVLSSPEGVAGYKLLWDSMCILPGTAVPCVSSKGPSYPPTSCRVTPNGAKSQAAGEDTAQPRPCAYHPQRVGTEHQWILLCCTRGTCLHLPKTDKLTGALSSGKGGREMPPLQPGSFALAFAACFVLLSFIWGFHFQQCLTEKNWHLKKC